VSYFTEGSSGGYLHKVRIQNIASGRNVFGAKPLTSVTDLGKGDVVQFLYKAHSSGMNPKVGHPDKNLYDAFPLVDLTDLKRTKDRKTILYGCNLHYLPRVVDKNKVIIAINVLNRIPTSLHKQTIHAYRLDRVQSKFYKSIDVVKDKDIALTLPVWTRPNEVNRD